jgi:hypothetical protein
VQQPKVAAFCVLLGILFVIGPTTAAPAAVGIDGPGGGELAPEVPGSEVLENSVAIGPESANPGTEAVFVSGCVLPGSSVRHRVRLPARGSFLHLVVPDRRGFNVVMALKYPGLSRRVNQFGPGRSEAFTVRTGSSAVIGTVTISGVRGSFGCYRLSVTP